MRVGAISGVSDLTAGADIEHTSAVMGAANDQWRRMPNVKSIPNAPAAYGGGDSGASTAASQNRAALLIAKNAK
jgi:hypothetical protein